MGLPLPPRCQLAGQRCPGSPPCGKWHWDGGGSSSLASTSAERREEGGGRERIGEGGRGRKGEDRGGRERIGEGGRERIGEGGTDTQLTAKCNQHQHQLSREKSGAAANTHTYILYISTEKQNPRQKNNSIKHRISSTSGRT